MQDGLLNKLRGQTSKEPTKFRLNMSLDLGQIAMLSSIAVALYSGSLNFARLESNVANLSTNVANLEARLEKLDTKLDTKLEKMTADQNKQYEALNAKLDSIANVRAEFSAFKEGLQIGSRWAQAFCRAEFEP